MELYNTRSFEEMGLGHLNFVQDNFSSSTRGTIRGIHFQRPPHAQGKLITALQGSVLDIAVDLRQSSPTYGQSFALEISAEAPQFLYIPPGFGHGFQVLSERCLFYYKCTDFYHRESDAGLAWDDPDLALPWADILPLLSPKDQQHPRLVDFDSPFL